MRNSANGWLARAKPKSARREREAAEARNRYLNGLAKKTADAWRRVEVFVAKRRPGDYDAAVALLKVLSEVGERVRQKRGGRRSHACAAQRARDETKLPRSFAEGRTLG